MNFLASLLRGCWEISRMAFHFFRSSGDYDLEEDLKTRKENQSSSSESSGSEEYESGDAESDLSGDAKPKKTKEPKPKKEKVFSDTISMPLEFDFQKHI